MPMRSAPTQPCLMRTDVGFCFCFCFVRCAETVLIWSMPKGLVPICQCQQFDSFDPTARLTRAHCVIRMKYLAMATELCVASAVHRRQCGCCFFDSAALWAMEKCMIHCDVCAMHTLSTYTHADAPWLLSTLARCFFSAVVLSRWCSCW